MRKGYNPYLIAPYKKKNWLYIIQFYINERGARQYPLTRPSSPRLKKTTDGDVNACKKWHLPLFFI